MRQVQVPDEVQARPEAAQVEAQRRHVGDSAALEYRVLVKIPRIDRIGPLRHENRKLPFGLCFAPLHLLAVKFRRLSWF